MGELNECLSTHRRHSAVSSPSYSCIRFGAGTVQSWARFDRGTHPSAVECHASRNRESQRKVRLPDAERSSSVQRRTTAINRREYEGHQTQFRLTVAMLVARNLGLVIGVAQFIAIGPWDRSLLLGEVTPRYRWRLTL